MNNIDLAFSVKCLPHLWSFIHFSPLCYIIATYSLETQTIVPSLLYPFHKLNSSSPPGPFTRKRSERILVFHQLPSPLDMSLMSWRAHTQHNGREKDAETFTDKMRERDECGGDGSGGGWKKLFFSFSDPNSVIDLIISIPLISQQLDIRSVTALLATIHNVNVNYRSLYM